MGSDEKGFGVGKLRPSIHSTFTIVCVVSAISKGRREEREAS